MKRSRKPSKAAPSVRAPRPLKVHLAPVVRTYMGITIELLPEQRERCQDPGCHIGAAFRVTWPVRGTRVTLLLCAHHSQIAVVQFRERLRAAASMAPSAHAASAHPPGTGAPPPLAVAEPPAVVSAPTAPSPSADHPDKGPEPENQE